MRAAPAGVDVPPEPPWWRRGVLGAVIGVVCAGLAVGVGELVTAFVRPEAAPIVVVGNRLILLTPEPVRLWAIRRFGTDDKPALLTGIWIGIAVVAVVVGIAAVHRLWLGLTGVGLFGAIGVYCALTTHAHRVSDIVPTLVGTVAALVAMIALIRAVDRRRRDAASPPGAADSRPAPLPSAQPGRGRRRRPERRRRVGRRSQAL